MTVVMVGQDYPDRSGIEFDAAAVIRCLANFIISPAGQVIHIIIYIIYCPIHVHPTGISRKPGNPWCTDNRVSIIVPGVIDTIIVVVLSSAGAQ